VSLQDMRAMLHAGRPTGR